MNCAGESARLTYSLSYSAPEVLCALNSGAEHVVAESALDVWAVGVIAYELMIGRPAFPRPEWMKWDIHAAAHRKREYPWESAVGKFRHIAELRALMEPVCACLARDPGGRPSAEKLLAHLNALFDHHGTSTTTSTNKGP